MVDIDLTIEFIVVDDVFPRYTVVVCVTTQTTSVYCEECDEWVVSWDGERLSRNKPPELLEMIVDEHKHQVVGYPVEIADDETENFI